MGALSLHLGLWHREDAASPAQHGASLRAYPASVVARSGGLRQQVETCATRQADRRTELLTWHASPLDIRLALFFLQIDARFGNPHEEEPRYYKLGLIQHELADLLAIQRETVAYALRRRRRKELLARADWGRFRLYPDGLRAFLREQGYQPDDLEGI